MNCDTDQRGMCGGRRTGWKNQICFPVLSLSCFEVFSIPKASDTPLFECKNKWLTATSAAASGRDCLSCRLPREGQWQMGCVQDFPVLPGLELGSPRACSVSPGPPPWRRWCELEKPSHQEVCKGSFSVTDHLFIHPSPVPSFACWSHYLHLLLLACSERRTLTAGMGPIFLYVHSPLDFSVHHWSHFVMWFGVFGVIINT